MCVTIKLVWKLTETLDNEENVKIIAQLLVHKQDGQTYLRRKIIIAINIIVPYLFE